MNRKQHTVMILEDEAIHAINLERQLRKWGYSVLKTATTAAEAIQRAKSENPHLMIIDIKLREPDGERGGLKAARKIRQSGGQMPIIFFTSYTQHIAEAARIGFFSYLNKNDSEDLLRAAVERALEHFTFMQQVAEARSATMARTLRDHFIRKLISPGVFATLQKNPESLRPKHSNVAIGFVDIRGFTRLSNSIQIEQMGIVLEVYFTYISEIILRHKGFIDKFIGDAVMWFHRGDEPKPICKAAIAVACDMQTHVKSLNAEIRRRSHADIKLHLGIGLAYGQCAIGIFGAPEYRIQYSIIGPPVNLASRMCSLAEPDEICIGDRIIEHCRLPTKAAGFQAVKGFDLKVEVRKIQRIWPRTRLPRFRDSYPLPRR
jgi:class 3 adenylate cyclase